MNPYADQTTPVPASGPDGKPLTRRQLRELEREFERARQHSLSEHGTAPPPAVVHVDGGPGIPTAVNSLVGSSQPEPPPITGAQRAIGAALGRPRPRGRVAVILAVIVVAAIVLMPVIVSRLGHGGEETGSVSSQVTAADAPIDSVLEVAGRVGSVPVVSLISPLAPATSVSTDTLIVGDGRSLSAGDAVLLSVSTFSGTNGANTTGTPTGVRIYRGTVDPDALGEILAETVTGATEGSRLVLRAPVSAPDGAVATEITVVDVLPTTAVGQEQSPVEGLPVVAVADDGTVSLSIEGLRAPSRAAASVLIVGAGQQIDSGDVIIARYAFVNWSDSTLGTSSYGASTVPGTIDMSNTMSGIAQQLVDVTVGSRIVLALPADQAAGDDALAVVIDILAVAADGTLTDATTAPSAGATADTEGIIRVTPSPEAARPAAAAPAGGSGKEER
ncbi:MULTISPECIES: hypothetical protein [unclassified Actinomyces]|uniref:hypothetical protein n=1 Tax=unclassified Actinomyces TaxID=2609248 RepID=UPI0013741B29|nr:MULTISPECIES: hypothetical protein [unclassified Actinomyces]MBW3068596.1 hypothetical protein [Actinomyces sp. 594]NDR54047.1 hypothetical protein [Actinomyces sp. 565]QHO90835.1 hypothetical protein CWT12_05140 [Actinomyces sp. 432]